MASSLQGVIFSIPILQEARLSFDLLKPTAYVTDCLREETRNINLPLTTLRAKIDSEERWQDTTFPNTNLPIKPQKENCVRA
jgi:hypothetical protein